MLLEIKNQIIKKLSSAIDDLCFIAKQADINIL